MYLALEGIDGAGKTTQLERLESLYPKALFTREPGGSALGQHLRALLLESQAHYCPKAEFLLFLADRAEHIREVIAPAGDRLIISDRSAVSGMAYAWGLESPEELARMNRFATGGRLPDRVVLLKQDEATLHARLKKRGAADRIEQRGVHYLLGVQERMEAAAALLGIALVAIDASLSPDTITNKIKELIDDYRA
jgi:dTMP kinase